MKSLFSGNFSLFHKHGAVFDVDFENVFGCSRSVWRARHEASHHLQQTQTNQRCHAQNDKTRLSAVEGIFFFNFMKLLNLKRIEISWRISRTVHFQVWNESPDVDLILVKGAGDRGLCAGGDIAGSWNFVRIFIQLLYHWFTLSSKYIYSLWKRRMSLLAFSRITPSNFRIFQQLLVLQEQWWQEVSARFSRTPSEKSTFGAIW